MTTGQLIAITAIVGVAIAGATIVLCHAAVFVWDWIVYGMRPAWWVRLTERRSRSHGPTIPSGYDIQVLKSPTIEDALGDFRVELAPAGHFDHYLARLMHDSRKTVAVGNAEVAELPGYKDIRGSGLVRKLSENLHKAAAVELERYLLDAYVRISKVYDPNQIAAEADTAVTVSAPIDAPLDADALAKCAEEAYKAAAHGDDGGEK